MNHANMDRLIDHLKKVPDQSFNMGDWFARVVQEDDPMLQSYLKRYGTDLSRYKTTHGYVVSDPHPAWAAGVVAMQESAGPHDCGAVACIAGHAALLFTATEGESVADDVNVEQRAMNWLGLDLDQADALFVPSRLPAGISYRNITAKEAARVCEHLRDTGEVDWWSLEAAV